MKCCRRTGSWRFIWAMHASARRLFPSSILSSREKYSCRMHSIAEYVPKAFNSGFHGTIEGKLYTWDDWEKEEVMLLTSSRKNVFEVKLENVCAVSNMRRLAEMEHISGKRTGVPTLRNLSGIRGAEIRETEGEVMAHNQHYFQH